MFCPAEPVATSGPSGDRNTVFYNPFRKVWVYSVRTNDAKMGRTRGYVENADALAGARWKAVDDPLPWVGADKHDPRRDDLKVQPQLYNLDCVAYESVLLGLFSIWRGQPKDRPKPNEVCAGFSRDGFHWHRPDPRALLPVSETRGDWNWGNVQSAGGCCLVVGDQLYFYVSGRAGVKGSPASGVSTTGLAVLRRDGFASMGTGGKERSLLTRPVTFRGKHLFVNVAAKGGLRAEVRRLIEDAYAAARSILTKQKQEWITLAEGLLEYETLSADEIRRLIRGERIVREGTAPPVAAEESRPGRRSSVPPSGRPSGLEPEPQPGS